MKWNAIIIIVLGLVIIGAVALIALNLPSSGPVSGPGNVTAASPTPVPKPVKADVLEKFGLMKEKVNASGFGYGGGSVQLIDGEEVGMVYIYKPYGAKDLADLLATGFTVVSEAFGSKDPLLVGVVDTSTKINAQTFKVDIYALERAVVEEHLRGGLTRAELAALALLVTPETTSLHRNNTTLVKRSIDTAYNPVNYTPPPDRLAYFLESLNQSGYNRPMNMQTGPLATGERAVSVVMPLKRDADDVDKYREIEAVLKACAGSYGDFDKFMISLLPTQEEVTDYYYVDASSGPVLAYYNGDISQYDLYNAINLTYYTK